MNEKLLNGLRDLVAFYSLESVLGALHKVSSEIAEDTVTTALKHCYSNNALILKTAVDVFKSDHKAYVESI